MPKSTLASSVPAVLRVEAARLARPELRREQRAVVRLPRQQLGEQRAADAPPLPVGRTCSSTTSKCGTSSHSSRWPRAERARDALRPPLPVRAGVAVAEPDDLGPVPRDEEHEVVALARARQPLRGPFVRERAGAERRRGARPATRRAAAADRAARSRPSARLTVVAVSVEVDDDVVNGRAKRLARPSRRHRARASATGRAGASR